MSAAEEALCRALSTELMDHAYQPIFHIDPPGLHGFEAVSRFPNGTNPEDVWLLAQARNLTLPLDKLSIHSAVREGFSLPGRLFVNVEPSSLRTREDMASLLADILPVRPIDEGLVLELTERGTFDAPARVPGVLLALDDCGTKDATFAQCSRLHPNYIKLDKSVVERWARDPLDELLPAWVALGQSLGAIVLAEGVEDPHLLSRLTRAGVSLVQGFAFGRPREPEFWVQHHQHLRETLGILQHA